MNTEEFKKLSVLERSKVKVFQIDILTFRDLYEHAKNQKEESIFLKALTDITTSERLSNEKNVYSNYFNDLIIKAYCKQMNQSIGGKKSKRTRNKPKDSQNTKINFSEVQK